MVKTRIIGNRKVTNPSPHLSRGKWRSCAWLRSCPLNGQPVANPIEFLYEVDPMRDGMRIEKCKVSGVEVEIRFPELGVDHDRYGGQAVTVIVPDHGERPLRYIVSRSRLPENNRKSQLWPAAETPLFLPIFHLLTNAGCCENSNTEAAREGSSKLGSSK